MNRRESILMKTSNNDLCTIFSKLKLLVPTSVLLVIFVFSPVLHGIAQSNHESSKVDNTATMKIIDETRLTNRELADELTQIYESTKRFQDIEVALAEGYIQDPMNICETAPMMGQPAFLGAMGVHYFRPDMLGITETEPRINGVGLHTDFRNPSVLIYEPQEDGSMQLVAIENLVFQKAWHESSPDKKPEFMGHEYFSMVDNPMTEPDESHMFEPHYDLHMYLYKENPTGLFSPFNPAVSCNNHITTMKMH